MKREPRSIVAVDEQKCQERSRRCGMPRFYLTAALVRVH
jgi:hypothetical protein